MILRYEVPVDDRWHQIDAGLMRHVGSRTYAHVEFWADDLSVKRQWFKIFGTGHKTEGDYVGSTYDGGDRSLVWHLFCAESNPDQKEIT